jgi:hypothetical protein
MNEPINQSINIILYLGSLTLMYLLCGIFHDVVGIWAKERQIIESSTDEKL